VAALVARLVAALISGLVASGIIGFLAIAGLALWRAASTAAGLVAALAAFGILLRTALARLSLPWTAAAVAAFQGVFRSVPFLAAQWLEAHQGRLGVGPRQKRAQDQENEDCAAAHRQP